MARAAATDGEATGTGRRAGLDRDDVIVAAVDLVTTEGPSALTMRRLADKLGVATPTIYWHVGSRDDLVAEVIGAHSRRLAALAVDGDDPRDRIFNAARNIWTASVEHRAFTSLAHQTGTSNLLVRPLEEALLLEIERAGLSGEAAASAAWSILSVIGGSLLLELRNLSSVPAEYQPAALWAGTEAPIAASTRAAMQADQDFDAVCQTTLRAVIGALIADDRRASRGATA
ncbi:MAG TPA: TetR family transcriptional regulator [Acidimicrobiales bacterium]|nr:TetR family transcriptional regulator [Acidimicrobiales bacterium]